MQQTLQTIFGNWRAMLRWLALVGILASTSAQADNYSQVQDLLRAGQFNQAMTQVEQYLASKPNDPQMRLLKGLLQDQLGQRSAAINTLTQLSQDHPELAEPHNNLAALYAKQGQYEQAQAALQQALRANPNYATGYENLGDIYLQQARQAYHQALQTNPSNTALAAKLHLLDQALKSSLTSAPKSAP